MRERWIDNTKGILIILVVLGHILPPPYAVLTTPASYIFLFHMPAFFMISGYLANPGKRTFMQNILGKAKRILGPYFFYLILIAGPQLLQAGLKTSKWYFFKKPLFKFLKGGQDLNFFYCGALWFLTCSFFIYIFFYIIELLPKVWMKAVVYVVMWLGAHYQSVHMIPEKQATFWLWDVAIIGVVYLAIGKYFKKYLFDKRVLIGSIFCVVGFIILHSLKLVPAWEEYGIELWSHTYKAPVLDFVLPVGIFVILANLVKRIPEGRISLLLTDLGRYSLAIMAMHQMVMHIIIDILGYYNVLVVTVIATLIPYLVVKYVWAKIPGIKKISF